MKEKNKDNVWSFVEYVGVRTKRVIATNVDPNRDRRIREIWGAKYVGKIKYEDKEQYPIAPLTLENGIKINEIDDYNIINYFTEETPDWAGIIKK